MRTGEESAIEISDKVQDYVATAGARFPDGIGLAIWKDTSYAIRGRLSTLAVSLVPTDRRENTIFNLAST